MLKAPPRERHRNRNPLAYERLRSRSHRQCGGVLCRRGRRADDGGKRVGGVSDPLCHPRGAAPAPFRRGSLTPHLVRTKVTARRDHERAQSSRKSERVLVFVVWSGVAKSQRTALDLQLRRPRRAQIVPSATLAVEHCGDDARVRLRREGIVFRLRNTTVNDASFLSGDSAARARQRS
jgi:hypothetical protein